MLDKEVKCCYFYNQNWFVAVIVGLLEIMQSLALHMYLMLMLDNFLTSIKYSKFILNWNTRNANWLYYF